MRDSGLGIPGKRDGDGVPVNHTSGARTAVEQGRQAQTVPGRVIRHRNKVQDHRFTDKYQEGKAMPGD